MNASNGNQTDDKGNLTSGAQISFWLDSVDALKYQRLTSPFKDDVVVVGAGIAGLTTAYCLVKSGRKVTVLEDGFIGSGETGRTTAHLVNALDDFYSELERLHGKDNAKLLADSHTAAIDMVEQIIREEQIDCAFKRLDGYLFLHPTDDLTTLQEEHKATNRAGIKTTLIPEVPGMAAQSGPCLRYQNQAQFHPMKYLHGLANAIIKYGGRIFTETHVEKISEKELVANGHKIQADNIVVATNTPVNDIVTIHTKQHPYRTYVIGATIPKGAIAHSLWWDTGDHDSKWVTMPYNYIRLSAFNEQYDLLIHGGHDHKTGQLDKEGKTQDEIYSELEGWIRSKFPMINEVIYRWSGQVMEPVDAVAFIGRNPGNKNIYIATGDSGNGMTHGTIAGMLIRDLINGKENPWEKIYEPSRISLSAAGDFLKEAGNMAIQYGDYLKRGDGSAADKLAADEGAIINIGLKKVAVYRDEEGDLKAYTAVCPHLGCVVQWNPAEKSFDCPCHGSRFTKEGKVINGPALSNLKRMEIKDE